jgi:hypothetical protein
VKRYKIDCHGLGLVQAQIGSGPYETRGKRINDIVIILLKGFMIRANFLRDPPEHNS